MVEPSAEAGVERFIQTDHENYAKVYLGNHSKTTDFSLFFLAHVQISVTRTRQKTGHSTCYRDKCNRKDKTFHFVPSK